MTIRRAALLAPFVIVALLAGCNSGKRDPNASTGNPGGGTNPPPANPTGPGTGATVTYAVVAPPSTSEVIGGVNQVLALAFTLEAAGGDVDLYAITLDSAGTLSNAVFDQALLCRDDNPPNGILDPAEFTATPPIAATPGMTANPDTFTISLGTTPLRVSAGAPATFFVLLNPGGVAKGDRTVVGQTVEVGLSAASNLDVRDTNNNALTATAAAGTTIGPAPFATSRVTVGIHPHLLISEIVSGISGGEYVEIYNPSGATVDLTNFYLTDFIDPNAQSATPSLAYYNVTTGANFVPPPVSGFIRDFLARFPAGAQLTPGQVAVVALDGADFVTTFPASNAPDFFLRDAPAGGGQSMLVWNGTTFAAGQIDANVTLGDDGETVVLFLWDQQSDLIQDVDQVNYAQGPGPTNQPIDKTGVSVDGPDAGTTPTQFQPETPLLNQSRTANGDVAFRTDFTEGAEVKQNGNGLLGHDETSEDFSATFTGTSSAGAATPGTLP